MDLKTDFNVEPVEIFNGKVHKGFYERAAAVDVKEIYDMAKTKGKRLIVCGHSLGGAAATLFTLNLLLSDYFNKDPIDVLYNKIYYSCIGYGNPFCLTIEVVEYCEKLGLSNHFINFINEGDIIPSSSNSYSFRIFRKYK